MRSVFVLSLLTLLLSSSAEASKMLVPVGAAVTDITPDYPIRLAGYASRKDESDGITTAIHARALVIGGDTDSRNAITQPLAVLVTVDSCGVTADVVEAVFEELSGTLPLARSHFALSSTHTHSAPWLKGFAPLIQTNITPEHQSHLDLYETQLKHQLVDVVHAAVKDRQPAYLSVGSGHADFARNRRVIKDGKYAGSGIQESGPVDHRVAILAAHSADGSLIAVLTNYACHATTNSGADNKIGGDWPGFAADLIESDHPGAVALVAVGCGADVNPLRSGKQDYSAEHGRTYADSVDRVLQNKLTDDETALKSLDVNLTCHISRLDLPFGPLPSRSEWEAQAGQSGVTGELARRMLKQLDSSKDISTELTNYPVQTWTFGNDLAMVFLAGEVVLDYSIRMGGMFDSDRLWVNAYCNDVPCYIPSKRVLREGGYEAESSLRYYGLPTRLSPEIEDHICWAVQKQLPHSYYSDELLRKHPGPKSLDDAMATLSTRSDLRIELVAAEPLIQDPVAFDWDSSGRLWVVEMSDYPLGEDGGRVRVLKDEDGDGQYDSAVTFLDNLPYPNGICVWRNGAIITSAPNILYAEDTNGDGSADQTIVLCTGFGEGNQQHRVNGLRWGMDGWMYLANGDSGGVIQVVGTTGAEGGQTIDTKDKDTVDVRHRDIRLQPDHGRLEAIAGQTQFGRERDDFGQWFGNNNSNPIWHYVLENRYTQRNSFAKTGSPIAQVSFKPGAAPVYPTSKTVARFNDFHTANRFTSACGTSIYRDSILGDEFYGNAFTCEPVHNLMSRLRLKPAGITFHGTRDDAEAQSEVLASSDNWFRPTMARTGPDGTLYVSDMYRQVIEHPEWIPVTAQRQVNLRAGSALGRIYRLVPADTPIVSADRSWMTEPWDQIPLIQVVQRLSSSNGWWRDTAQRILQHRQDEMTDDILAVLPWNHELPAVRVQAVCSAAMVGKLTASQLITSLNDSNPRALRRLIPLLEDTPVTDEQLATILQHLSVNHDPAVRFQLACTLGSLTGTCAETTLGELLATSQNEPWIDKAVLSSLNADNVVTVFRSVSENNSAKGNLALQLVQQCQQLGRTAAIHEPIIHMLKKLSGIKKISTQDINTAAGITKFIMQTPELSGLSDIAKAVQQASSRISTLVLDDSLEESLLVASLNYLTATGTADSEVQNRLSELLSPAQSAPIQQSALKTLLRTNSEQRVLDQWPVLSPDRRNQALDAMISHEPSIDILLTSIAEETLSPADLGAVYQDQLLNHRNETIQARSKQLLAEGTPSERVQVVADWNEQISEITGDAAHGKSVFSKRCATCHKLQEVGNQIGANLSSLRDRTTPALVTAILDPNKAVETRFMSYTAVRTDGRSVSGMLKNETSNSVTPGRH